MDESYRIEDHDESIPTPRTSSSLHAPFKQPGPGKEAALKKVKVEPEGEPARKLYLLSDEEKALIATMKDLALEGWKAGQGWKRGTYPKAATMVQSLVPGCRITAKNVENKLHSWGKQYRLLHDFLRLSGVAIDQETYAVVLDSGAQWSELQQSNSKYAQLCGKTFPHYDSWCELFGQHRATGSHGRDHTVAEVRARSVPSEVFEIRDEPDEEDVQESGPVHNSHIEQSPVTEKSPITTKSPSGVDGATSVSRGKRKMVCNELPPEFVDACISFDRLVKKKEHVVDDESKKERLDRLADVVEEHMELNVANKFRLIKHLMADDSGYLYFLRLDRATREYHELESPMPILREIKIRCYITKLASPTSCLCLLARKTIQSYQKRTKAEEEEVMETSAMTMDDVVEEIMRIHRSLPARPGVEEIAPARGLIENVEMEVQLRLEGIQKQRKGKGVPEELFTVLQEMQRNAIHFQGKEQKREAQKLVDLEGLHSEIDDLIQRASEFIRSHSGSRDSGSTNSSTSSLPISGSSLTSNGGSTVTSSVESSLASSFYNEKQRVKAPKLLQVKDDMFLKKTKKSFHVDGIGAGAGIGVRSELDSTLEKTAASVGDGDRLSLIMLARCIEVSAKKGSRELLLQHKLSDQIEWLPDSIGKLSSLVKLDLSQNRIVMLPNSFGGLFSLQTLDLNGNRIRELPESIGVLQSLTHLNLRGNQLTILPPTIGKLVGLVELDLSSNGLTVLPETIGSLTSLERLNIETNDLEEIPHSIGRCASLKELHADYNHLKALPEAMGRLEYLEILTVRYNNIRQLPTTMASLANLRHIDFSFNELESVPESLCFATKLVKMDISNNFADLQALPRSIGNLEMLEELLCHNNQIRTLPDSFGLLVNLRVLNLEGNPILVPPRAVVEKGAQAVVQYMSDLIGNKDAKPLQPVKNKKPWARMWFFSKPNKRKRNEAAKTSIH